MSRKLWVVLFVLALISIVIVEPVCAEVAFKWGPYLRIRHEYWKNWSDMQNSLAGNTVTDDVRSFFRIKTSLWGQATYNKDISLYAKLTNENRSYLFFQQPTTTATQKKGFHYDIDEVVVDNLYLDVKKIAGLPVDARVGRQELMGQYGEGFLISDGTPQDGSRTWYFDAVKASWKINKENSLDLILISNDRTDEKLPIINRKDGKQRNDPLESALNLTDEQGIVVYHKADPNKNWHFENYYIYKTEEGVAGKVFTSRENRLHTVGSFAKYTFAPYTLKAQLANQTGEYGDEIDREALGGYVFLTRAFKNGWWTPTANVGYMYLSGDDPNTTDKVEAWNPLFSRWPIVSDVYSELYYLTYNTEGGALGYWTNTQLLKAGVTIVPTKKTKLSLAYYYLWALEPVAATTNTFGTEKNRGSLYTAKFDYAFNKNISAYVMGEILHPGDFYVTTRDDAVFVRSQLEFKY